uniref:Abi family protein n=1 Tax=Rhodococcus qingshengii TaxID=334542 RepID=UPI001C4E1939|nr:Abi family protein [Rhodococcus qingshengii]
MTAPAPDSNYAKPFLTVPEQIRRLRGRGMDCGTDAYASRILEHYGYYRLSGYWHLYRARPASSEDRFDEDGREVRLDSFVGGTSLAHVVALYDFDHELRSRLSSVLSTIEISLRFFIGHRLGRTDSFAHRNPEVLGAMRPAALGDSVEPTTAYCEWLEEYDRHEKRARDGFVLHFREKYGPHLPIWVATEVMSFGGLSNLYTLMRQADQEILAARFQLYARDGRGDRGALANWLNSLRNLRNICAHYGRVWNRTFDVLIDAPGLTRDDPEHHLYPLAEEGINNKLYGVLLVLRHLLSSIAPGRSDVDDIVAFIAAESQRTGFAMHQLGFPDNWKADPVWERGFVLDIAPMLAAGLLDRCEFLSAPQARAALSAAEAKPSETPRTPEQLTGAKKAAQKALLRTYQQYKVVIEVELGRTKYYPAFQFRDGKIIDALAEINQALANRCVDVDFARVAVAQLDWWQTPHPDLTQGAHETDQSPLDLLYSIPESEFAEIIASSDALRHFVVPKQ